jgi:hypothetical protein
MTEMPKKSDMGGFWRCLYGRIENFKIYLILGKIVSGGEKKHWRRGEGLDSNQHSEEKKK